MGEVAGGSPALRRAAKGEGNRAPAGRERKTDSGNLAKMHTLRMQPPHTVEPYPSGASRQGSLGRRTIRLAVTVAMCGIAVLVGASSRPARGIAPRARDGRGSGLTTLPAPPNINFEPNEPFSAFPGSVQEKGRAVDWVVAQAAVAPPHLLYGAASTAYRLDRLDDALFLYSAGNLRSAWETTTFPPTAGGGDSPVVYFAFLARNAAQVINPAAMSDPRIIRTAVARLEKWAPLAPEGYRPGYPYRSIRPEEQAQLEALRGKMTAYVKRLSRKAALLDVPEYRRCVRVVLHQSYEPGSPITREASSRAQARLEAMEQAYPSTLPASPGAAPCDDRLIDPAWRPRVEIRAVGTQIQIPQPTSGRK